MKDVSATVGKLDITALKRSFMDACSDKDFKDYIDKLDIHYDILMKYTSSLEDCFLECRNCKNCRGLEHCKNKVKGYRLSPIENGKLVDFSYVICEKMKKNIDDFNYQKNLELFEMPKQIKDASFKDLYKDDNKRLPIIKYFKEFIDKYPDDDSKGIYLTGSFGAGKTYLIAALFNEMAKKDIKSILVYYPEFLRSLKTSFQNNTEFKDKFNSIKKVPLLLLDDIGAENCTVWSRDEILGPILQYRMENFLPTFFTSNLTLEELENFLAITNSSVDRVKARRIIERIKQLTVTLELVSKNRRG